MARNTEVATIGGNQYRITQLGAVAGRGLYKKFVTAVGPLLRDVVSGPALEDLQKKIAGTATIQEAELVMMQALAPIMIRAIEDIPGPLFEEMCVTFAGLCVVATGADAAGQPLLLPLATLFDDHFAGKYSDMTAWLGHCIRVNGFLGMLGNGSADPAPVAAAAQ